MQTTVVGYLGTLPAFLLYFFSGMALIAIFIAVYVWTTPHREIALVRQGNVSAAICLASAGLGFIVPLASAVAHSVGFADMLIWAMVGLIVQLGAYRVARLLCPSLSADVEADRPASAIVAGAVSIGAGLLNAACMTF